MTQTRPLSLRALVSAFFALILCASVLGAVAFVGLTAALSHATIEVGTADMRMRASLRTKVALLWYGRESDLTASRPTPEALSQQSDAEAQLRADVAETRRLALPTRRAQLDNLVTKTAAYIAERKDLQQQGLPLDVVLERANPKVAAVFTDLEDIIAADDDGSRRTQTEARRLHTMADIVAAVIGTMLVLALVVAFVGIDRRLQRPLLALSDTLSRFRSGDERSRAAAGGVAEVGQMAATFNDLADRLAQHEKERLAFLAGVVHDLRNPLSPLKLAVGALARGPTSASELEMLTTVAKRQVERLDRMVGDLLDAAQIESGRLEIRLAEVDLRDVAGDVADLYRHTSDKHTIDLRTPSMPIVVSADRLRIEQVLINLVSNAIKYSPRGGKVTIAVFDNSGEAAVTVSDEGIGVSQEERERIFEPFHRTGHLRGKVAGAGLGLAVARKIAEAHGGQLDLESSQRGSTFRLTLDLRTSPSPPRDAPRLHPRV
jgi:two-component system, OmpR family, sensor histidine kinase MtrB